MIPTALGLTLVTLGLAGIRYAPAIVAAQHGQGMAPLEGSDALEETDRVRATKGSGVVLAVVGCVLLAYGLGLV